MQLTGIHHLTAISAEIAENKRFFTEVLGMRLVKRTVNQDDVGAYHLFYADGVGSPGTDMTFFDWPVQPERRGSRSVTRTALRVSGDRALDYWQTRLTDLGAPNIARAERDGRQYLDFEDNEGQRLSLVDDGGAGDQPTVWERGPVPAEHQVRGLGPITMTVPDLSQSDRILQGVMKLRPVRGYQDDGAGVTVYEMGGGGPSAELHLAERPELPRAKPGAGGVHHVAFRTPGEDEYHRWTERLTEAGVRHSGEIDRFYFRSLYFREPHGVLFEIATDGPGFVADEDRATLGEALALPPFLEAQREQIEAGLKPID